MINRLLPSRPRIQVYICAGGCQFSFKSRFCVFVHKNIFRKTKNKLTPKFGSHVGLLILISSKNHAVNGHMDTHVNYARTTCKLCAFKYHFLLRRPILLLNLLFLRLGAFWGWWFRKFLQHACVREFLT